MPSVPVTPGRNVQVQPLGNDRLRYGAPRNLVGPAVERFGHAVSQAAEGFDEIEATYDRADALNLDNTLAAEISALRSEFSNLRGDQPGRELQDRLKALRNRADQLVSGARSIRAQNMLRRALDVRISNAREVLTRHADEQMFQFNSAALVAGRNQAKVDAIDDFGTDQFGIQVGVGLTRLEERARLLGQPDEVTALDREQFLDEVHSGILDLKFAAVDPPIDEIGQHLVRYANQISPALRAEVLARLQRPLQDRLARSDAGEVLASLLNAEEPAAAASSPAAANGDASLDAITMHAESRGNRYAASGELLRSPAGAMGEMQVMPETARDPGFGIRPWDGKSPDDLARVGREYRAAMERRYGGDLSKMWAAYNWGPGNVDAAVKRYGENWLSAAPEETQNYIARNMVAAGDKTQEAYANAPREWDRSSAEEALNAAAAGGQWSPERTQRAREELYRSMDRDEALLKDRQNDAREQAAAVVQALGSRFTGTSQIPRKIWKNLSPSDKTAWEKEAEANRKPVEPQANGVEAMALNLMRYYEPEKFKGLNLAQYAGEMTRAELDTFMTTQAKMRTDDSAGKWSPRSGIVTALNYRKKIDQLDLDKADEAAILQIMEAEAWRKFETNGHKPLTDNDYQDLFRSATRNVVIKNDGWLWDSTSEKPRYRVTLDEMPPAWRNETVAKFRRSFGRSPSGEELLRLYRVRPR